MDVIDTFVIVCTVVLFCSWGYLIWSNWKGKGYAVRFPPYGFDPCPIGYILKTNGKCEQKEQTRKIIDLENSVDKISSKITSQSVCNMYNDYQGEESDYKFIYDGVPSKYSHKNHSELNTNIHLKKCSDPVWKPVISHAPGGPGRRWPCRPGSSAGRCPARAP